MKAAAPLLPTGHLRSDDLEAGKPEPGDSDPEDHDARAGKPHVHRITGEFADLRLTAEFGPMVFRSMFPLHAAGLGLLCVGGAALTIAQRDIPGAAVTTALSVVLCALGIWARFAVHQWEDTKKAQSFGALAWAFIVGAVNFLMLTSAALVTEEYCSEVDSLTFILANPLVAACVAVVNATHGMEFWHATSLIGLMLGSYIAEAIVCGFKPATILAIGELVLMAVGAHFAQLVARRGFMRSYYTQESRDRLDFRDKMASHRERRASGARIAVLRETGHANHSSSSAPKAAPAAAEVGPSTSADNGLPPPHPDEHLLDKPLFMLTRDELRRREWLMAQRDAEEHDDQASDAMSQDGGVPPPQGVPHEWSTTASSTSTRTRNMTRRQKKIERLRHAIYFERPIKVQVRRNPFI